MSADVPAPLIDHPEMPAPSEPPNRRPVWSTVHLATLAVAALVLLWANRDQWFKGDEWEFLVNRGFSNPILDPWYGHNEHWSTLPIAVYTFLRDTVGLSSYWPYISVLIAIHLALAHLLFRVMIRATVAPPIATAGAAVFAVFGAGSENLLWAFQIGFVGSLALGWAAALLIDRSTALCRRDGWAVLLLVASLMCSGIGVPVTGFVALLALARSRGLLRPLVVGGIPAAVFLLWYVLVPQPPAAPIPRIVDSGAFALVEHVVLGLRNSLASATGLPALVALILLVMLATWAVVKSVDVIRRRPGATDQAIALVGLYGAAAFWLISGFGRADTVSSRYVYVTIAMALPGLILAISNLAKPIWAQAIVLVGLVAVIAVNVNILDQQAAEEAAREQLAKETIVAGAAIVLSGEPVINKTPEPRFNPDIDDASIPELVKQGLPTAPVTETGMNIARLNLQVNTDGDGKNGSKPNPHNPVTIAQQVDVAVTEAANPAGQDRSTDGRCVQVTPTGPNPHLVFDMPGGPTATGISSASGGAFTVSLDPVTPGPEELAWDRVIQPMAPGDTRVLATSLPADEELTLSLAMPQSVICGVR